MEPYAASFVDPLMFGAPALRRRAGRPKGSRGRVLQEARALGVHHFAFVRSSLLGLDLAEAFNRYLAWSETTTDLRHVLHRRHALLKHIIEAGRHLDASLALPAKITHFLDLQRSDATVKQVPVLPSLDEWIETEGLDPEGWSEADLLAEYKTHFGLDNADAQEAAVGLKDPAGERARAQPPRNHAVHHLRRERPLGLLVCPPGDEVLAQRGARHAGRPSGFHQRLWLPLACTHQGHWRVARTAGAQLAAAGAST
jgi:hypothetical protein